MWLEHSQYPGAGFENHFVSLLGSKRGQGFQGGWLNTWVPLPSILSLVPREARGLGHPARLPLVKRLPSRAGKRSNSYLQAEGKVGPQCEDPFSICHPPPPPLSTVPPPPLVQTRPTFVVWHEAVPSSVHRRLRKVFSWRRAARH